jgi:hypothetical protein
MSEQEFELYLKLRAKCLRLTSGQREQIADELRDHLEERLAELARAGVPREKAVVQALDEFGDAAVLAAHFTTIARLKRRRFLMRLSLGSVGALTAGLLIAFAFWPDNRAARGPQPVVAQDGSIAKKPTAEKSKTDKANAEKPVPKMSSSRPLPPLASSDRPSMTHPLSSDVIEHSKNESRIEEALNQPVDFNIEPQSFKDAIDFIAARYQIPIVIDQKALDEANVDTTTEVKGSFPGIKLRNLFKLLLEQLSAPLTYVVEYEVLKISTLDKINTRLVVVVYDCRDLVQVGTLDRLPDEMPEQPRAGRSHRAIQPPVDPTQRASAGQAKSPAGAAPQTTREGASQPSNPTVSVVRRLPLIQTLIAATGRSDEWDESTTISEFGGLLVVRQNPIVHEQIKRVLADIRQMKAAGAFASLSAQYDAEVGKQSVDRRSPQEEFAPKTVERRQTDRAAEEAK